jgi:hypothetical protein
MTEPTRGPTPEAPKAQAPNKTSGKSEETRDLWSMVMLELVEGFLASVDQATRTTARIYKDLLDDKYNRMEQLGAEVERIGRRKEREGTSYKTYESDLEKATTDKQVTQMEIGQLEAGLNGLLQVTTTNMNMAMKIVNEIAQLGGKIVGGLGG